MADPMQIAMPQLPSGLTAPKPSKTDAKLREAADGFESLLLTTLLKGGRLGEVKDDLTGSSAVDSTRDMLDAELARSGAQHSHLGISDAVVRQFTPQRHRAHPGPYLAPPPVAKPAKG